MNKEKHLVYRWVMGGLILLLLIGVVLLVIGLSVEGSGFFLSPGTSV